MTPKLTGSTAAQNCTYTSAYVAFTLVKSF